MNLSMLFEQNDWIFFAVRAATLVVALLCFAMAFGSWRRASRRDMQKLFAELGGSRGETRELSVLTQALAAQVAALQAQMDDRRELAAAAAGSAQRGYELALQMARNGAAPEEIVNASGVTRREAQLLRRVHSPALD